MTKEQILNLKRNRMAKLKENGKNVDSPGIIRKLSREIRNLEK